MYSNFIKNKQISQCAAGFTPDETAYPESIKDHQRVGVTWACKRGKSALFFNTGLGKTLAQLSWADRVVQYTGKSVIIIAPLAVSHQTIREGEIFGVDVTLAADDGDINEPGIYITNYEKISRFNTAQFVGVVLDESSILKGMQGKIRKMITAAFASTQYKLSCTATPAPNDFMELGTQSEFLGIMSQVEMLAMFFIHDGGDTSKWRLKGHGKSKFWEWLSTWALFISNPADIGFDGAEYDLPPIKYHSYIIETQPTDTLFVEPAQSLLERNRARKDSIHERCEKAAQIVNSMDTNSVVWCHLNDESKLLAKLIHGSVEVTGSDKDEHKTNAMLSFADGDIKCLITKPKIAGFGMNWQSTNQCVFVGLSDSWEAFYQAIRRQWRYGQTRTVDVHIVSADTEGAVVENIRRKDLQNIEMSTAMIGHMAEFTAKSIFGAKTEKTEYTADAEMILPSWVTL